ncbi:MAG: hypothetical protein R2724_26435 [Bryobacterales bacterium]
MRVQEVVETVVVQASAIGINPVETSSQGEVGQATLDNAPKANRSFDDVLPLIPGVVRGPPARSTSTAPATPKAARASMAPMSPTP